MAIEGVGVTEGVGKNIAVDTVAGKEFQCFKLALGAEDAMDNLVDSGQQVMAASLPVVIASNQTAVPVSAASLPLPTGASTSAAQATLEAKIDTLITELGQKTEPANQQHVIIDSGGGSGGTATADDGAFTPAVGLGTPMMGVVTADSVDSGDVGVIGMLANRQQKVTLYDSAGVELAVGGGTQYDEDTASTAGQKLTMAGVVRNDVRGTLAGTDGDRTQLQTNADGDLRVDLATRLDSTNDSVAIAGAALTSLQLIDDLVAVAHDAADAGNPVKIGAKAIAAETAAVAAGDRTNLVTDLTGKLINLPYANPENFVSGATSDVTGTTATTVIAAPAAGLRNYITHILVTNSHATVGTFVNITEETSGTVLYTGYAAALGGGFSATLPVPLRMPTTAKALQITCVTTGSNVRASASGFKGV